MKRLVAHGYHVPHLRDTTGMGAPSTPGTAVLTPAGCRARPAPAASQRPVPAPRNHTHQRGSVLRGINEGSRDSPVRPAPHLWPPGGDGRPSGFPLCSAPRRHRRRTTGRGQALSTRPELRCRHNRPSNPRVHSQGATSCRNGRFGRSLTPRVVHNYANPSAHVDGRALIAANEGLFRGRRCCTDGPVASTSARSLRFLRRELRGHGLAVASGCCRAPGGHEVAWIGLC
jgi:hypothetical protein